MEYRLKGKKKVEGFQEFEENFFKYATPRTIISWSSWVGCEC